MTGDEGVRAAADAVDTVGDALPREIARVRDKVLPAYEAIGPSGAIARVFMRADLDAAARAIADGDVIAMIRCLQALRGYHT